MATLTTIHVALALANIVLDFMPRTDEYGIDSLLVGG
jgi:hypothetical protein